MFSGAVRTLWFPVVSVLFFSSFANLSALADELREIPVPKDLSPLEVLRTVDAPAPTTLTPSGKKDPCGVCGFSKSALSGCNASLDQWRQSVAKSLFEDEMLSLAVTQVGALDRVNDAIAKLEEANPRHSRISYAEHVKALLPIIGRQAADLVSPGFENKVALDAIHFDGLKVSFSWKSFDGTQNEEPKTFDLEDEMELAKFSAEMGKRNPQFLADFVNSARTMDEMKGFTELLGRASNNQLTDADKKLLADDARIIRWRDNITFQRYMTNALVLMLELNFDLIDLHKDGFHELPLCLDFRDNCFTATLNDEVVLSEDTLSLDELNTRGGVVGTLNTAENSLVFQTRDQTKELGRIPFKTLFPYLPQGEKPDVTVEQLLIPTDHE